MKTKGSSRKGHVSPGAQQEMASYMRKWSRRCPRSAQVMSPRSAQVNEIKLIDIWAILALKQNRAIFNEIGEKQVLMLHLLIGDDGENSLASSLQDTKSPNPLWDRLHVSKILQSEMPRATTAADDPLMEFPSSDSHINDSRFFTSLASDEQEAASRIPVLLRFRVESVCANGADAFGHALTFIDSTSERVSERERDR